MAIFSRDETRDVDGVERDPLSVPNDLALPIAGDEQQWVGIAFEGVHPDLLVTAIRDYVRVTDNWRANRDDRHLYQERRLAFIRLLKTIAAGSEYLANRVASSYERDMGV